MRRSAERCRLLLTADLTALRLAPAGWFQPQAIVSAASCSSLRRSRHVRASRCDRLVIRARAPVFRMNWSPLVKTSPGPPEWQVAACDPPVAERPVRRAAA